MNRLQGVKNVQGVQIAHGAAHPPPRAGWLGLGCATLALMVLSGCATGPDANPQDPLEPLNRQVQQFNDAVDRTIARPIAVAYRDTVPSPLRTGVNNFFNNLRDVWSFVNASLQARPQEAVENFTRVKINTFFGFGGVLDIATEAGVERTPLDFGNTLGRWGVPPGPYLVLPLMGPSTLRDTVGRVVDQNADPIGTVEPSADRGALTVLPLTDNRADLLPATDMVDRIALDRYSFIRDAFLQLRAAQIRTDEFPDEEESAPEAAPIPAPAPAPTSVPAQ